MHAFESCEHNQLICEFGCGAGPDWTEGEDVAGEILQKGPDTGYVVVRATEHERQLTCARSFGSTGNRGVQVASAALV
jgi:hypothetical protein